MRYAAPVLDESLCLTPDGEEYLLEIPGADRRIRLGRGAVAPLWWVDGRRTVDGLESLSARMGLRMPDGFLERLLGAMVEAGLARWGSPRAAAPLWALPGTHHRCEGCGRSCEGQLVGPLPEEEVARIEALWPALVEKVPRLEGKVGLEALEDWDGGVFLAREGERCVFLGEDRLCDIHRHFGAEAKPSICRLFPFVQVLTEDGIRFGVNNECTRHHASAARECGEPIRLQSLEGDLAALPEAILNREIFVASPLGPEPEGMAERKQAFLARELALLTYLGQPDASVAGLARMMVGGEPDEAPPGLPPEAWAAGRALLLRVHQALWRSDSSARRFAQAGTGFGAKAREVLEALDALSKEPHAAAPTPDAWEEAHALDNARRMFWLREALQFQSPQAAAGGLILGWLLGLWWARRQLADAPAEARHDAEGELLAAWSRLVWSRDVFEEGLGDPRLFQALWSAWA
jgi:Fe-S-cluster containining protein